MDEVKFDFEQAKAKHLMFKSKLRSILYGESINEEPVLSHYECGVGKWIYSHALQVYSDIPEMKELEKVHADIHLSARELVKLYKEGKIDESRKGLDKMESIADSLVNLLSIVQNKVDPNMKQNIPNYQNLDTSSSELLDLLIHNEKLDRKIKEESAELINERQLLHDFFMQAPAILAILKGPDHVFEFANQGYIELIGNRNPVGKTVIEAVPEVKDQGFIELLDNVYNTGKPFIAKEMPAKIERYGVTDTIYVDFNYYPHRNTKGEIEGILVFVYEVTQTVLARKIIEESNVKSRFITEAMPQKVWTAGPDGTIDYFNEHWMAFTGLSFEKLKECGWSAILHPDDVEENTRLWKEAISNGTNFQYEHRLKRKDGEYRWHLSRSVPHKDDQGNVTMWIGTNTEIHDLKRAQEKLIEMNNDLETKVKFRNIELEREVQQLKKKIHELR